MLVWLWVIFCVIIFYRIYRCYKCSASFLVGTIFFYICNCCLCFQELSGQNSGKPFHDVKALTTNGKPKELFFSSDLFAIVEHTKNYLAIEDDEIVHIKVLFSFLCWFTCLICSILPLLSFLERKIIFNGGQSIFSRPKVIYFLYTIFSANLTIVLLLCHWFFIDWNNMWTR